MQRMEPGRAADFHERLRGLGIGQMTDIRSDPLFMKKRPARIVPEQVAIVVCFQYNAGRVDKIIEQTVGEAPQIGCIAYTPHWFTHAPHLEPAGRFARIMIDRKRKKCYVFY